MKSNGNLYKVLGVPKSADQSTIKKAYRKLARENHPDVNPDDVAAEARFKEASSAYEVLSDASKRALYDEFGDVALSPNFDAEQARAYQQYSSPGGFGAGQSGGMGDEWLHDLFGFGRQAPNTASMQGRTIKSEVNVDFETAAKGGERVIRFGSGKAVTIRIPQGVKDGETLRLKGQGDPSPLGGPSGDLLLKVLVAPHPVFRREGLNLHMDLPLTISEAMLGASVKIETLQGKINMKIPAGSQTGQTLRLKGKGIKRRSNTAGDLHIHLQVHVPQATNDDVLAALEVLEQHYTKHPRDK